jgi:hypothetical protein
MTDTVILGGEYVHPERTGTWRVEAASVPDLEDRVWLCRPEHFTKSGFVDGWRGTWQEFLDQWERASE